MTVTQTISTFMATVIDTRLCNLLQLVKIAEATSAMCTNTQYNFELSHETCRRISQ